MVFETRVKSFHKMRLIVASLIPACDFRLVNISRSLTTLAHNLNFFMVSYIFRLLSSTELIPFEWMMMLTDNILFFTEGSFLQNMNLKMFEVIFIIGINDNS